MVQINTTELGSCVLPGMSSSSSAGQFPAHGSLYAANNLSGLGMGSLQNLARGRPGSVGGPPGGGMPTMGGGLHSQGLQGRLTPTHFGSRSSVGGISQGMSLLQTSSANSRNPLFSRKMGYDQKRIETGSTSETDFLIGMAALGQDPTPLILPSSLVWVVEVGVRVWRVDQTTLGW